MLTKAKLEEYKRYHGYYDGFYLQKVKKGKNINSDEDWYLTQDLIGDIKLVRKGVASEEYVQNLRLKLMKNCDTGETIAFLEKIAEENW